MVHAFWNQIEKIPNEQMFVDRKTEPAVSCTYGELKTKIQRFRSFFREHDLGVRQSAAVAAIADQSPDSYAFFLACFFSNVTPVVISPHAPLKVRTSQLRFAKEFLHASVFLKLDSGCSISEVESLNAGLKTVDVRNLESSDPRPTQMSPPLAPLDEQLAWVLFTSGTSGLPKPILIPWRAVNSFTQALLKFHVFHLGERASQSYVPSFDPYFADLLGAALQGATLVPFYPSDAVDLPAKIKAENLSHWSSTPSLVNIGLLRLSKDLGKLESLRRTIFTGEPLSWDLVQKWRQLSPQSSIENLYGPTETTIWITRHVVDPSEPDSYGLDRPETVPIGKLFPGHTFDLGAESELVILGPQVCVKEKTRSGRHPTGDLVKALPDGALCWIGRADYQVKVRGQRLQLDVLEAAFSSAVKSQVTVAVDSKNLSLMIFTTDELSKADILRGLEALSEYLPPALMPKSVSKIDFFPIRPSGKRLRNSDEILKAVGVQENVGSFVRVLAIEKFPTWILDDDFPAFFYSEDRLQQNLKLLKGLLKTVSANGRLYFSVKSNPHPAVLRSLAGGIDGFDVSSQGEHRHVLSTIDSTKITASGPAKSDAWFELLQAKPIDVLHLDNLEEWSAVKLNPTVAKNYTLRLAMDGLGALKLGFSNSDARRALESIRQDKTFKLSGFHVYLGREAFSWKTLRTTLEKMKELFDLFPDCFSAKKVFIGAGLPPGSIAEKILEERDRDDCFNHVCQLATEISVDFEVGRALVHSAGTYVCSVIAVKERQNRLVVILNGGLQHLASSLTSPTFGNSEIRVAIWRQDEGLVSLEGTSAGTKEIEFYGSLGTWSDRILSSSWRANSIQAGDRVLFSPAGAYGVTAASSEFISLEPVREFFQKLTGEVTEQSVASFYLPPGKVEP